jgi:predicted nucleic acid-binding protein
MPDKTITALDSSIILAGLLAWHEAHDRAFRALVQARANEDAALVVPAPALVEAYAVMTRLPAPHRLAPADAIALLSGSFEGRSTVVSLSGTETWRFLHAAADHEIAGGRGYDALILQCARKARATTLLTLDRRDFSRLDPGGIRIVVPA